nr:hypothetical protein GCM10025732_10840 [Glycomyces mayteni]
MGVVQIVTAVIAFAYTALAIWLFVRAGLGMLALVRLGAPDLTRKGDRGTRVKTMLRETLGHTRMLQWSGVGLAHWAVFFGFFLLFPALVQSYFEVLNPHWSLPVVGHWDLWLLGSELLTVLTGVAILSLFLVRILRLPRAHRVPPEGAASDAGQRRSSSRFEGSRQWMAFYIEATIFTIVLSHMTVRTIKVSLGEIDHEWTSPVSTLLAGVWDGASENALLTAITLVGLLDILVSWTFFLMLALHPSMGIGWHRVTAFFNIYFKRNAGGAVSSARPSRCSSRASPPTSSRPTPRPTRSASAPSPTSRGRASWTSPRAPSAAAASRSAPRGTPASPCRRRSSSRTCATTCTSRPRT